MGSELRRMQVLLEAEQQRTLADLAAERDTSVSALLREAVAQYLMEAHSTEAQRQALDALDGLQQQRAKIMSRQGMYAGDLVTEVREERDREIALALSEG